MANTSLKFVQHPVIKDSIIMGTWMGWTDAAQTASRAIKEVVKQYDAELFAVIDPEEFYVFTENRPQVSTLSSGKRHLKWPTNEFFYYAPEGKDGNNYVFFLGTEPDIRWQTYVENMTTIAASCDSKGLILVGALMDSVPHTRPSKIVGSATNSILTNKFKVSAYQKPTYEGPVGMTSVLSHKFESIDIPTLSVWAHIPHYLRVNENPITTVALLREIEKFLPQELDLSELEKESKWFADKLAKAMEENTDKDMKQYIRELEKNYDSDEDDSDKSMEQNTILEDVNNFLRDTRDQN